MLQCVYALLQSGETLKMTYKPLLSLTKMLYIKNVQHFWFKNNIITFFQKL